MALRTISQFKSTLVGGGVRPNLFEVTLNFPNGTGQTLSFMSNDNNPTAAEQTISTAGVSDDVPFLVKAAALPASNISPVEVPFRGRILKIAGDRSFETWTITVINDTDFSIRSAFEKWMNIINRVSDNTGLTNPADYQADAYIYQLDRTGETLRKYHFYDIFPTQVTAIELSYDQPGIQEFQVELQVLYWEAVKGNGANAGGEDIN